MKVEELKKELEQVASRRFYLNMEEHLDFKLDKEYEEKIDKLVEELKQNKIKVIYKFGYDIEYKEVN